MKNQKGISSLIGIIIIVVVALFAIGGIFTYQYFSTPKTETSIDETAGWKTYINDKYGFEVKYPQNLFLEFPFGISQEKSNQVSYVAIQGFLTNKPLEITVERAYWTAQEVSETIHMTSPCQVKKRIITNIIIGGLEGKKVNIEEESSCDIKSEAGDYKGGKVIYAFVVRNGILYKFSVDPSDDLIFSKILSTFKFTQ